MSATAREAAIRFAKAPLEIVERFNNDVRAKADGRVSGKVFSLCSEHELRVHVEMLRTLEPGETIRILARRFGILTDRSIYGHVEFTAELEAAVERGCKVEIGLTTLSDEVAHSLRNEFNSKARSNVHSHPSVLSCLIDDKKLVWGGDRIESALLSAFQVSNYDGPLFVVAEEKHFRERVDGYMSQEKRKNDLRMIGSAEFFSPQKAKELKERFILLTKDEKPLFQIA